MVTLIPFEIEAEARSVATYGMVWYLVPVSGTW
jgi:hypothetical protein